MNTHKVSIHNDKLNNLNSNLKRIEPIIKNKKEFKRIIKEIQNTNTIKPYTLTKLFEIKEDFNKISFDKNFTMADIVHIKKHLTANFGLRLNHLDFGLRLNYFDFFKHENILNFSIKDKQTIEAESEKKSIELIEEVLEFDISDFSKNLIKFNRFYCYNVTGIFDAINENPKKIYKNEKITPEIVYNHIKDIKISKRDKAKIIYGIDYCKNEDSNEEITLELLQEFFNNYEGILLEQFNKFKTENNRIIVKMGLNIPRAIGEPEETITVTKTKVIALIFIDISIVACAVYGILNFIL